MKVAVCGLWHLGTVIAACLASVGHDVTGFDENVEKLRQGEPPLFEPGLAELLRAGLDRGTLRFTSDRSVLREADVVWIAWDTPVDDDDRADVEFVLARAGSLFDFLHDGARVMVSSQLPLGSVRRLEQACGVRASWPAPDGRLARPRNAAGRGRPADAGEDARTPRLHFACVPENLRLGKAIESFAKAERFVVGVRGERDERIAALLAPFGAPIEWMSVESAEMTKHALNAFLATSVAFINEIATVCEQTGADARDVARALKSDPRIGPRAYLNPGAAFAGGTLARDVQFLAVRSPFMAAVKASNDRHKEWIRTKLLEVLGNLHGKTIALWGLTYKPGTDTLRRSGALELARWLAAEGARVQAHDPAVKSVPADIPVALCGSPSEALRGADALVVATEWPEYRDTPIGAGAIVIDPNGFVGPREGLRYYSVGQAT